MDPERFEQILEEEAGGSSELSRGAYDQGRDFANLPD